MDMQTRTGVPMVHVSHVMLPLPSHPVRGAHLSRQADATGSVHSNLVRGLQPFEAQVGPMRAEFTTTALDGKIVFWTRDELSAAMSAVAIS